MNELFFQEPDPSFYVGYNDTDTRIKHEPVWLRRSHRTDKKRTLDELWYMLIPTSYSWLFTFSSHQNQELRVTKCQTNIDSEKFGKTMMLPARPRPSSSGKCICPHTSWVSKTALLGPCVRVLSFTRVLHWEYHKISTLKPKTMTVKVLNSRGK